MGFLWYLILYAYGDIQVLFIFQNSAKSIEFTRKTKQNKDNANNTSRTLRNEILRELNQ